MATTFPEGFVWGTATSAYQIEGAVREGGRGVSIWDRFSHTPGKTENGDTGDVASDHYHRWRQDVGLMKELGLNAYRFSIAWPRIIPDGSGAANQAGLDFYDRLVDALLAAGIEPFPTLYHWDLPEALYDKGGWLNRDAAGWFADYAAVVSSRLGDRVRRWITHNEPFVAAFEGYALGSHAPGLNDPKAALQVAHHLLLSHGRAVPILRQNSEAGAQVGIALNLSWVDPASERQADVEAAQRFDGLLNRLFLDPLFRGAYPADMLAYAGPLAPEVEPEDLLQIATPIDFLGVNYYSRAVVADDPQGGPLGARQIVPPYAELTEMGWEVYPEGLRQLLVRLHQEYHPAALYITENGCAAADRLQDGRVHDPQRIAYLSAHLAAAHQAIAEGVPLRGYLVWSLLDNFEWAYGYTKRFGLVYVDYATQARVVKDSGAWFRQVATANALP
ncbi:MAG TPA: GH1 family beta-glucosidase [Anaerolineae bacterium]|nr:GH1 family beta-glucosidase [Anaerolineae bacterium]HOQ97940.1 GH1 family beta-glucosidase [Anaerolineae bacterium]HPL27692.1 GH1 family beta-glucosidase [Anaerolineae bacterium]